MAQDPTTNGGGVGSSPFASRDYRRWFAAETFLTVSMSTQLAVSLVLIDLWGSVSVAGVLSSVISAVAWIGGVIGGGVADTGDRRRIIAHCVTTSVVLMAILIIALGVHQVGSWADSTVLGCVVTGCAIAVAASEALADPAMDAALKELITPAQYPRAMSAAQARTSLVSLASRPMTGALYGLTPVLPFLLRLVCDSTFLVLLTRIRASFQPGGRPKSSRGMESSGQSGDASAQTSDTQISDRGVDETGSRHRVPPPSRDQFLTAYRHGLRAVWQDVVVRLTIFCAPLVNLMVFTATSWVVFTMRDVGHDSLTIGLVSAGFTVGSLIGAALTPKVTDTVRSGWIAIVGLAWMATILLVMFTTPTSAVVVFILATACMIPSPSIGSALFAHVFHRIPSDFQGRTLGIFTFVNGLVTVAAPTLAALAVDHHASRALGIGVTALGAAGIAVLTTSRSIRHLPALKELG